MEFLANHNIEVGVIPVDFATARTSDVVCMKGYNHLAIVIVKDNGTADQDEAFTFTQGTDVAFGTSKALLIDTIWQKDATALTTATAFSKTSQTAATSYEDETAAEKECLWVIDIDAEDLDSDGGYDCVRVAGAGNPTAAQIGTILFILSEPRYAGVPSSNIIAVED